jgi:hypothetical protein
LAAAVAELTTVAPAGLFAMRRKDPSRPTPPEQDHDDALRCRAASKRVRAARRSRVKARRAFRRKHLAGTMGAMMALRNWALAAAFAAGLVMAAAPARAQVNVREPDPVVWLREIYDLYLRAEKSPALQKQATIDLIVKRASKSFAALFRKNKACEARGQGVCALDWDFVIDGQDSQLSDITIGSAVIAGDKATVTATFKNFTDACVNTYYFVREDGQWKVDDVETKSGAEAPLRIAKMLRDYKY